MCLLNTFVLIVLIACFCCVRFSFSIPSQEIGLGNVSEMTYLVSSGHKTLTQSISVQYDAKCLTCAKKLTVPAYCANGTTSGKSSVIVSSSRAAIKPLCVMSACSYYQTESVLIALGITAAVCIVCDVCV